MNAFKPNVGKVMTVDTLWNELSNLKNLEIDWIGLTNICASQDGWVSGASSTIIQFFGACDDGVFCLSLLPNQMAWLAVDNDDEDDYKFLDTPSFFYIHAPDVINNSLNWKSIGLNNFEAFKLFHNAVVSVALEGTVSDSVYEFEEKLSDISTIWSNRLTGLPDFDDIDDFNVAGLWFIHCDILEVSFSEDGISIDGNLLSYQDSEAEIHDIVFDAAWEEQEDYSVGVGIIK
tara:strand:- start:882 stop:1577 length:696 start_codon:yes stop_codon:yes gene_type:complete